MTMTRGYPPCRAFAFVASDARAAPWITLHRQRLHLQTRKTCPNAWGHLSNLQTQVSHVTLAQTGLLVGQIDFLLELPKHMIYKLLSKLGIEEKELPSFLARPLFRHWWKKRRTAACIDLALMIDYFVVSPSFATLSPYWAFLARRNIEQLIVQGLENFKQTIARNYFVIVHWRQRGFYENLFSRVSETDQVVLANIVKQHEHFGPDGSASYNVFCSLLLNHVRKLPDAKRYLALEEPMLGNPATITHDGKQITSDLLNSLLDYDTVFQSISEQDIQTVLEVGGGYGRSAFCNIRLLPRLKRYIMVDIPPALFVAQSYITQVFPEKKAFRFRPFTSFKAVEDEFNDSELVFLLPEHLAMLPSGSVDLIVAIDCLHEMDKTQVRRYFHEFDRLGKRFFFKCFRETDQVFFQWHEYPVHAHWKEIFNRPAFVPANYFESLYEMH
jgi:putative sugar O-methyltransferase